MRVAANLRSGFQITKLCALAILSLPITWVLIMYAYLWFFTKSTYWWDDIVMNTFSEEDWMENFRVSKLTFDYLCTQLIPLIKRTVLCKAITVPPQGGNYLWCLATCGL